MFKHTVLFSVGIHLKNKIFFILNYLIKKKRKRNFYAYLSTVEDFSVSNFMQNTYKLEENTTNVTFSMINIEISLAVFEKLTFYCFLDFLKH